MGLYDRSGVSVESWVEIRDDVEVRYEICAVNDNATLHFGHKSEFALTLDRDLLTKIAATTAQAITDLEATDEGERN